jgi:hypothetical protein
MTTEMSFQIALAAKLIDAERNSTVSMWRIWHACGDVSLLSKDTPVAVAGGF